jgi:hypothetical protein
MKTCTKDTKEGRNVTVTDIPGAILYSDMNKEVHMKLEGEIAELIVKLERKYTESMCGKTNMENQS